MTFNYVEFTYNMEKREREKVADWEVFKLCDGKIAIRKKPVVNNLKPYEYNLRVFKVVDDGEFVFKALKTKIKAAGGSEGLVDWMIKNQDTFECRIRQLLNFTWDSMKYEYL